MALSLRLKRLGLSFGFWALAVLFIRYARGSGLVDADRMMWLMIGATLVVSVLFVDFSLRRLKERGDDAMYVALMISLPGVMANGLAGSLAPGLYGPPRPETGGGAGWILLMIGVSLLYAFLRRQAFPRLR